MNANIPSSVTSYLRRDFKKREVNNEMNIISFNIITEILRKNLVEDCIGCLLDF